MNISNITVGTCIANLRTGRGMTQQQLASVLGVSHQAVSKWETGAALPDIESMLELTRLFGVTMEQLLSGDIPKSDEDKADSENTETAAEDFINATVAGIRDNLSKVTKAVRDIGSSIAEKISSVADEAVDCCWPDETKPHDEQDSDDGTEPSEVEEPEAETHAEAKPENSESDMESDTSDTDEAADPDAVNTHRRFSIQALKQLAPFMTRNKLSQLVLDADGELTLSDLNFLAPFLNQDALEMLIDRINKDEFDPASIVALAPFLKKEALFRLICEHASQLDMNTVKALAPFLKRSMVDSLIDMADTFKQSFSQENLQEFSRKTKKKAKSVFDQLKDATSNISKSINEAIVNAQEKQAEYAAASADVHTGASELKSRVARAALEQGAWEWLISHAGELDDAALLKEIALAAINALDTENARSILESTACRVNGEAMSELTAALADSGKQELFAIIVPYLKPEDADALLEKAVADKQIQLAKLLSASASKECVTRLTEKALIENNWDVINALSDAM